MLARSMPLLRFGSDRTALVVEAYRDDPAASLCRLTLEGRQEAEITALVASEVALKGYTTSGVRHLDELLDLDDLAEALVKEGVRFG